MTDLYLEEIIAGALAQHRAQEAQRKQDEIERAWFEHKNPPTTWR